MYVAELKCELAFENYRYLRLTGPEQLLHHQGAAFKKLLMVARDPTSAEVRLAGKPFHVDGAVLVWGALGDDGRKAVMAEHGFADVLSVEAMLDDLHTWESGEWRQRVRQLGSWSKELFDFLATVGEDGNEDHA